jgi:Ca-activated chloride channel family protein
MKPILNALVALGPGWAPAQAQQTCTRDARVVFDGSGSMAEMGYNLMDEPRIGRGVFMCRPKRSMT